MMNLPISGDAIAVILLALAVISILLRVIQGRNPL